MEELRQAVEKRTLTQPGADVAGFVEKILQRYGNKVMGIFMYGSVLSSVTKSSTSFPDFFVITDGYRRVFQRISHWLLAYPLPTNIYHLRQIGRASCRERV